MTVTSLLTGVNDQPLHPLPCGTVLFFDKAHSYYEGVSGLVHVNIPTPRTFGIRSGILVFSSYPYWVFSPQIYSLLLNRIQTVSTYDTKDFSLNYMLCGKSALFVLNLYAAGST